MTSEALNESFHPSMARRLKANCLSAWAEWDRFWFSPTDPAPLCLMRILAGGMLFYSIFVWGIDFNAFLGPKGWNSEELIRYIQRDSWAFSFWWYVPQAYFVPVHVACLIVVSLFWIGCWTRITSILSFIIHISYSNRGQLTDYGLDQITCILVMYLMVGPSGAMYSVDGFFQRMRQCRKMLKAGNTNWRFQPPQSSSARLALRLTQIHYCIIYFFAGHSKLQGRSWWTGEAMWRAFANYEYQSTDMTWLAAYPYVLQVTTAVVLLWEISFAFTIWVPRLRMPTLVLGLGMHLGIGACMGMWTFGLMMMFGYVAYFRAETIHHFMNRLWGVFHQSPEMTIVIPRNSVSINSVARMKALDTQNRLTIEFNSNVDSSAMASPPVEETSSPVQPHVLTSLHPSCGTPVVYVVRDSVAGATMKRYLDSRGFETTLIESIESAIQIVKTLDAIKAIICNGCSSSTEEIQNFDYHLKELDLSLVSLYLLDKRQSVELMAVLSSETSAVMQFPVSLRDVKNRIIELLEQPATCELPSMNLLQVCD